MLRWNVENAWINKIEGAAFKASGNEVAIESRRAGPRRPDARGVAQERCRSAALPDARASTTSASTPARRRSRAVARTSPASSASPSAGRSARPVPVESWRQFEAYFGGVTGAGLPRRTPCAAFFENGGRRCWVVRVASRRSGGRRARASTWRRQGRRPSGASRRRARASGATTSTSALTRDAPRRRRSPTAAAAARASYTAVSDDRRVRARARWSGSRRPAPAARIYGWSSEVDPVGGASSGSSDRPARRLPVRRAADRLRLATRPARRRERRVHACWSPSAGGWSRSTTASRWCRSTRATAAGAAGAARVAGASIRRGRASRSPPAAGRASRSCDPTRRPVASPRQSRAGPRPGGTVARRTPTGCAPTACDFVGASDFARRRDADADRERRGLRWRWTRYRGRDRRRARHPHPADRARRDRAAAAVRARIPACRVRPDRRHARARRRRRAAAGVRRARTFTACRPRWSQHCERLRDRFALLDPPRDALATTGLRRRRRCARGGSASTRSTRRSTTRGCAWSTRCAAAPRARPAPSRRAATSPARSPRPTSPVGVHKAPANAPLGWAQDVTRAARRQPPRRCSTQLGINVIRALAGPRPAHPRRAHGEQRPRLALRQRAPAVMMIEKAIELAHAVGGVRAERRAHRARSCRSRADRCL